MSFVCPLLYFILFNLSMVVITKKSFGKCLPTSMFISILSLFMSQFIFSTFYVGLILNFIFGIVGIFLLIFKPKFRDNFKKNFLSPGFWAFLILYLFIFIFDVGRSFTVWDEWSHWGVMVQEMLRLDKFYSVASSTLMVHKDYPPMLQIFELLFCMLSGGYKESTLLTAVHLITYSLVVVPIVDEIISKKKIKPILFSIFLIIISMATLLVLDGHGIINTIYNDYFMAILTAYSIYLVIFSEKKINHFYIVQFVSAILVLTLTKQMGLPLAYMAIFIFLLDLLFKLLKEHKNIKSMFKTLISKVEIRKVITIFVVVILLPLLFYIGWGSYVSKLECDAQFKLSDIRVSEVVGIVKGTSGEEYQRVAARNYINFLFNKDLINSAPISMNYIQLIILLCLILIIIWYFYKDEFKNKQLLSIFITMVIGTFGYTLVMLLLYMFSFNEVEGPAVASFERYMPTFIFIWLFLYIYIIGFFAAKKDNSIILYVLGCILLIIQTPFNFYKFFPTTPNKEENIYLEHANVIKDYTEEGAKVFIVSQNMNVGYSLFIKYYAGPRFMNVSYFDLPLEDEYREIFDKEVVPYMSDFDYVYLAKIDDEFIDKYSFLFSNEVCEGQLYKINYKNKKLKLSLV